MFKGSQCTLQANILNFEIRVNSSRNVGKDADTLQSLLSWGRCVNLPKQKETNSFITLTLNYHIIQAWFQIGNRDSLKYWYFQKFKTFNLCNCSSLIKSTPSEKWNWILQNHTWILNACDSVSSDLGSLPLHLSKDLTNNTSTIVCFIVIGAERSAVVIHDKCYLISWTMEGRVTSELLYVILSGVCNFSGLKLVWMEQILSKWNDYFIGTTKILCVK